MIVLSARVEAFLRAAARKGYRITETIVAIPKEDNDTTYFKENFHNGDIVYTLEDKRIQGDRAITSERLVSKYFSRFICRLDVTDIKQNRRLTMTVCEMTCDDVLSCAAASDNGIFKTKWEKFKNEWGNEKSRKVINKELNEGSIWNVWTSEMVAKTIIRRALKRVREVLPELKETVYAFDNDDDFATEQPQSPAAAIEIPLEVDNVDLDNLTERQSAEAQEMFELFVANPRLAEIKANEIIGQFNGENAQSLINIHYACIAVIRKSKNLASVIAPLFGEAPNE